MLSRTCASCGTIELYKLTFGLASVSHIFGEMNDDRLGIHADLIAILER